jgi:hypothetical protein
VDHSCLWWCCYALLPGTYTGETLAAEVKRVLTLTSVLAHHRPIEGATRRRGPLTQREMRIYATLQL